MLIMPITDENVKKFIRDRIFERSPIFLQLEAYAQEHNVPIIQPETSSFLKQILHLKKPERILELGTAIGYSAIVFASACEKKVHIDTIEKCHDMAEIARRNIDRSKYASHIHVIEGDAYDVMVELNEKVSRGIAGAEKYDLVFIDAAKGQYMRFFEEALKLTKENGLIVCDNVFIKGLVANPDEVEKKNRTMVRKMVEFVDYITTEKSFETSLIPIGDGIALVRPKVSFVKI
jgi:predicted O-methyltransferase YrrM